MKTFVGAVCLAAILCGTAQAADDPAIVACEAVIKKGLVAPKSYERVKAVVYESSAIVEFDAVNRMNAPLRHVAECKFFLGTDSNFYLKMDISDLEAKTNSLGSEIETAKSNKDAVRLGEIESEANRLLIESLERMKDHMLLEAAADATGVYPIAKASTELVAEE